MCLNKFISLISFLFTFGIAISISSCSDDDSEDSKIEEISKKDGISIQIDAASEVTDVSATLSATYTTKEGQPDKVGFIIGKSSDISITKNDQEFSMKEVASPFSKSVSGLQQLTTYYYKAYALYNDKFYYSKAMSFTTEKEEDNIDKHAYVDLALPSGTLWATTNVGADYPEDYGDYFAWGETDSKSDYQRSTNKYCNGPYNEWTKYVANNEYGTADNKTELDLADDAAYMNWGKGWRMPSKTQLAELRTQCIWTWTTQKGKKGYLVESKMNGNSLFLPAAGSRQGTGAIVNREFVEGAALGAGDRGYYWSRSLDVDYCFYAKFLFFYRSSVASSATEREYGGSVRPVRMSVSK